jgi:predicted DNA-binding protein
MSKEKDTQVTLRIPNEMKEKLQKISEENEETLS